MNYLRLLLSLLLCCGLISVAYAQDGVIDLITSLLKEKDKEIRGLAFEQIRKEAKGEAVTKKLAELLPTFPPETQVGLLSALADRGDAAAAPAVRELLAKSENNVVKVAAIKALGPLGGAADLKLLVGSLTAESDTVRDAARDSLTRLPGDATTGMITELKESPVKTRAALLPILTARRAQEAVPVIIEAAGADDASLRAAALAALAELGNGEDITNLMPLVLKSAAGREREMVERTIAAVSRRFPTKEYQARPILFELQKCDDPSTIAAWLPTLGRVGGSEALEFVDNAVRSKTSEMHVAGVRALCNWPDGSVVSRLLQIARTDSDADIRKATFQALVRIAPLADERDDKRRLDTVRTVFAMCGSDAERNQVLDRAKAIRNIETLRYLLPFYDQPQFGQQACLTTVELAHHSSLRESNKDEFMAALDRVQKVSKDPVVIDRAERYKTGQTWYRPKSGDKSPAE